LSIELPHPGAVSEEEEEEEELLGGKWRHSAFTK
jgi:hypothetical protein